MHPRIAFTVLFCLLLSATFAQTSTYYFNKLNRLCTPEQADFSITIRKKGKDNYKQTLKIVNTDFVRIEDPLGFTEVNDTTCRITPKTGFPYYRFFHRCDSGYLIRQVLFETIEQGFSRHLFPLVKEGTWQVYDIKSHVKISEQYYVANEMTGNKNWNKDGSEYIHNVFYYLETPLKYNNGDLSQVTSLVMQNVQYPEIAVENGISGKVYIQFVVMEDGTTDGIRILRGVDPSLDQEAIRALKTVPHKWNPAVIHGRTVRAMVTLPVVFRLK
jgi:TonB family protein